MIDLSIRVANSISKSSKMQKFFTTISNNASDISVKSSNGINFILRPATIMATTKSKNLLDGAYCASSSIASGISETINSKIFLKPFNNAVQKSVEQLKNNNFFKDISQNVGANADTAQNIFKSVLGRIMLIAIVPLNSIIKMVIHPPLAHKVASLKDTVSKNGSKLNAIR